MGGEKGTCDTEKKVHDVIKKKGFLARMWSMLHTDDFEKRLQYISKEESAILLRMKKRSQRWRRISRDIIGFSVILEVVAVGYAITTTRVEDMDWKFRVLKFLPMFLLPGVSSVVYSAFASFIKLCDRKDQRTLERLRTERQAKIDELKEKTNYYTTHQLIQRYDPDPAAKAAAATILASKLGSDSGLKVYLGDESELEVPARSSSDVEALQSTGLRNRRQGLMRSTSTGSSPLLQLDHERPKQAINEDGEAPEDNQLLVNTNRSSEGFRMNDGGWIARIAALLVGEDPMQSYALICGNCHMHNGLAHKEDFLYITYYCPHCQALNRPKHMEDNVSSSSSPKFDSGIVGGKADGTGELDWSHNVLTNKPKRLEVNVTSSSRPPKPDSRIVGGKADATSKLDLSHDVLTNKPQHLEENVSSSSASSPKLDSGIVSGKADVTGEPDSSHNVLANRPKHPEENVSSSSSPKLDSAIIGGKADGTGQPDSSHDVLANRPKHPEESVSSSCSPKAYSEIIGGKADGTSDNVLTNRSPVSPGSEIQGVDGSEAVSNPATSVTESSKDV